MPTKNPTKAQYMAATATLEKLDAIAEGDIIQSEDARRLMPPGRPEWHETQTYALAARRLGLEQDVDGEWYVVME